MNTKSEKTGRDMFEEIDIKTPVMEAWLNSLADIALSLRLQNRMKIVAIDRDHAFLEKNGALMMTTTVGGEVVRMVVPDEMWSYDTIACQSQTSRQQSRSIATRNISS